MLDLIVIPLALYVVALWETSGNRYQFGHKEVVGVPNSGTRAKVPLAEAGACGDFISWPNYTVCLG